MCFFPLRYHLLGSPNQRVHCDMSDGGGWARIVHFANDPCVNDEF